MAFFFTLIIKKSKSRQIGLEEFVFIARKAKNQIISL